MNQTPQPDRGSLVIGFFAGWGVLVGSWILVSASWYVLGTMHPGSADWISPLLGMTALLPEAAMIALLVWFAAQGKTRSAVGVALTFASIIALALLLVAACFGLLASGSFH